MQIREYYFSEIEEILKWPEWKINLLYFENLKYDLRQEIIQQKNDLQEKNKQLDIIETTYISKIKL